jgi:galactonate dehydratase
MRKVKTHTDIPVASGERLATRWQFRELLDLAAVDIVQPDMTQVGGLLEATRVADMAAVHGVLVAPHCPRGPIATAVGRHFAASTPNFMILEYPTDLGRVPWRQDLVESPEEIVGGHMSLPTGPGLGVELLETELTRHRAETFIREIPGYFEPDFTIA